uniref:Uncharacterized protein n=1 Tax=Romanomermis culicivorax TaxID=13658 RepID=A0A915HRR2_ROMCU
MDDLISLPCKVVVGTKEKATSSGDQKTAGLELSPLGKDARRAILKSIVDLFDLPVDADTLHAAFRTCLRLTRDYSFALEFLELGGVEKLLRLRQHQSFVHLPSMMSLLIRHIMEDEVVLSHTMEKIIRHVVQGGVATVDSLSNPNEFYYVMRLLGGIACRDPILFSKLSSEMVRIKVPPPRKSDDDEAALLNPILPLELRTEPAQQLQSTLTAPSQELLSKLLNYLVSKEPAASDTNDKKDTPLVQKAAVLKMLSELIRSYNAVASFVAEYKYTSSCGELVTEECSALAFFLDHLLVAGNGYDAETIYGVRAVVATLSASNHCEEAQGILVTEIKTALQRALTLSESSTKHTRICSLVALITMIKDTCPTVQVTTGQNQFKNSTSGVQQQTPSPTIVRTNNIIKWFIKKKIILDLARIPHSLDISSPHFVNTMNCALKPLEELTRAINAPHNGLVTNRSGVSRLGAATEISRQRQPTMSTSNHNAVRSQGYAPDGYITLTDVRDQDQTGRTDEHDLDSSATETVVSTNAPSNADIIINVEIDRDNSQSSNNRASAENVINQHRATILVQN